MNIDFTAIHFSKCKLFYICCFITFRNYIVNMKCISLLQITLKLKNDNHIFQIVFFATVSCWYLGPLFSYFVTLYVLFVVFLNAFSNCLFFLQQAKIIIMLFWSLFFISYLLSILKCIFELCCFRLFWNGILSNIIHILYELLYSTFFNIIWVTWH